MFDAFKKGFAATFGVLFACGLMQIINERVDGKSEETEKKSEHDYVV